MSLQLVNQRCTLLAARSFLMEVIPAVVKRPCKDRIMSHFMTLRFQRVVQWILAQEGQVSLKASLPILSLWEAVRWLLTLPHTALIPHLFTVRLIRWVLNGQLTRHQVKEFLMMYKWCLEQRFLLVLQQVIICVQMTWTSRVQGL